MELKLVDMKADRQAVTDAIMEQLTSLGFLALGNVPDYDEQELYKWQKWLFAHSKEEKQRLYKRSFNPDNSNIYRGFAPFIENDPSHKELYEIGLDIE